MFNDLILGRDLTVQNGEIAPRNNGSLALRRRDQRVLSKTRINMATDFAQHLSRICPGLRLVGISGSTAYASASPADDLDFFVVTRRNRLWSTLLAAMLSFRMMRVRRPSLPTFCFNLAMDDEQTEIAFRTQRDPLFAREALALKVVYGGAYYQSLLDVSGWMNAFFPSLYRVRLRVQQMDVSESASWGQAIWYVLNLVSFATLAPYLWLIGLLRNARLTEQGVDGKRFKTVVSPSHCAFESVRYESLRQDYRKAF